MDNTKINSKAATTTSSGFGTNSNYSAGRFFNKDGTPNMSVTGVNYLSRFSLYNAMINLSGAHFILIVLAFYLFVNVLFAILYTTIGINNLGGIEQRTLSGQFWEAFFFSAQTISTVGYGHVYPKSLLANSIAAAESVLGLLTFAIITGIIYGRFSKPRAFIRFSQNVLMSPFRDGTAVMFRLVPFKHNHLVDAEVKVSLVMKIDENGQVSNKFFNLPLELSKINSLILSWTIVHPIDEESPFYNLSKEDLLNSEAELLIFFKAFDESYSNHVISRTSYTADEFVHGAKFILMYNPNDEKSKTILHVEKLNQYERMSLEKSLA